MKTKKRAEKYPSTALQLRWTQHRMGTKERGGRGTCEAQGTAWQRAVSQKTEYRAGMWGGFWEGQPKQRTSCETVLINHVQSQSQLLGTLQRDKTEGPGSNGKKQVSSFFFTWQESTKTSKGFSSVQFSHSVMSDSLWPQEFARFSFYFPVNSTLKTLISYLCLLE